LLDRRAIIGHKVSGDSLIVKTLLFTFLMAALLRATAWCDLLPPHPHFVSPTTITVANLKAYPGFKFSYTTDGAPQGQKFVPLRETQVFRERFITIRLFVEDGKGEPFEWASVKTESGAKTAAISILDVHREGKKIKVSFKIQPDPATEGKSARNDVSPMVSFMLSGFSLGAVVVLMRRKRALSGDR
jgi:hypothetical protein